MLNRKKVDVADAAERLEHALSASNPTVLDPQTRELLAVARMLRPAEHQSEAHRSLVFDRIVRHNRPQSLPPRGDAGTHDLGATRVPVSQLGGGAMGMILLADVETITPARAKDAADKLRVALERAEYRAGL